MVEAHKASFVDIASPKSGPSKHACISGFDEMDHVHHLEQIVNGRARCISACGKLFHAQDQSSLPSILMLRWPAGTRRLRH